MKDKVIQTAGKVWKVLGEKGPVSAAQLAKAIKTNAEITNQAIGWLAREDKIKYIEKGSRVIISLVDTEQQMFKILKETPLATASKN
jgi:hypothetical protein